MFRNRTPIGRRAGGALGAVALAATGVLVLPTAAGADDVTSSYAQAQFLSGSLAGSDLANVVALQPAVASNDGTQPKQTSKDPLGATVLDTVTVQDPDGIQLDLGSFVDAGAVGQYAEASNDGTSYAAAGAIGSDGAVGAGAIGTGAAGDLSLDLDSLVAGGYASILTDLSLSLDAVAAEAQANLNVASGDYRLAGANLTFTSPAIGDLTDKVNAALAKVDESILNMSADDGILGNAVDGVLDPVLGVIGSSADVSVTIDADIHEAVDALLTDAYGDGSVRFNLETGLVTVDLAKLLGGHLNNLPEGTELLQDAVISQVLHGITDTVSTLADQIVDRVRAALNDARIEVRATLDVLTPQGTTQEEVCRVIDVPIIGDLLGDDGIVDDLLGGGGGLLGDDGLLGGGGGGLLGGGSGGGLLGGLLGKSVAAGPVQKDIIGWTTETVCELVDTLLPSLQSTVDVHVVSTIDDLLDGNATTAKSTISLLGGTVNAGLNVNLVLDALADGLADGLFDDDGTISELVDALGLGLVDPAVSGLLGGTSVHTLLTDILSIKVNLKETSTTDEGKMFTQTAVRVTVLGGAASLDVAAATVGPNVTEVVDPGCQVNCGPGGPGDPDPCVSNCSPGNPIPTGTNPGGLAMTGVGIAMLIQLVLALLAAGAILAYAGYKKRHPAALVEG